MEQKILKFSDISHLSLYQLFSDTEYNDELKFLFDEIVEGNMANLLLVLTSDDDYNIAEKQFFEKLNREERTIFQYAQACNYAHNIIKHPLNENFDENYIGILNAYFKNIKFIK